MLQKKYSISSLSYSFKNSSVLILLFGKHFCNPTFPGSALDYSINWHRTPEARGEKSGPVPNAIPQEREGSDTGGRDGRNGRPAGFGRGADQMLTPKTTKKNESSPDRQSPTPKPLLLKKTLCQEYDFGGGKKGNSLFKRNGFKKYVKITSQIKYTPPLEPTFCPDQGPGVHYLKGFNLERENISAEYPMQLST